MVDKKTVHVELERGVATELNRMKGPGDSYSDVIQGLLDKVETTPPAGRVVRPIRESKYRR